MLIILVIRGLVDSTLSLERIVDLLSSLAQKKKREGGAGRRKVGIATAAYMLHKRDHIVM